MAYVLFISEEKLKDSTALNLNVDVNILLPFVREAQKLYVETAIGTQLTQHLKDHIIAGTLSGHYQTLVETYCKPVLIHWAMVEYLPFGAYTISNKGIYKHTSENATNVEKDEVDFLIEKERKTAQYYTNRLIDYLTFNAPSKFSQYYTSSNEDISPDTEADFGGWVL